jgi:hypothetical protein
VPTISTVSTGVVGFRFDHNSMGPIYNTATTGCVKGFSSGWAVSFRSRAAALILWGMFFDFLKRRRLSDEGQKRLIVALARAEETIVETHVDSALDVIEAVGDEMPIDRVLEIYLEALEANPQRAEIIARRVLSKLGD